MLVRQFSRFLVVGTLGFLIDAAILFIFNTALGLSPLLARIPSFSVAVVATWWLNRAYTFQARDMSAKQTLPSYISSNMIGLTINLGIYTLAVMQVPFCQIYPIAALAAGSIGGLFFNFTASKFWVFNKGKDL